MSVPLLPLDSTRRPVTPANLAKQEGNETGPKHSVTLVALAWGAAPSLSSSPIDRLFCCCPPPPPTCFDPCRLSNAARKKEKKTEEAGRCVYLCCSPTHAFTLLVFTSLPNHFFFPTDCYERLIGTSHGPRLNLRSLRPERPAERRPSSPNGFHMLCGRFPLPSDPPLSQTQPLNYSGSGNKSDGQARSILTRVCWIHP